MRNDDRNQIKLDSLPLFKKELRGIYSTGPGNPGYELNEVQSIALGSLEHFGWQLAFVRRSSWASPVIVVKHKIHTKFAVLEEDGSVNLSPAIRWRH